MADVGSAMSIAFSSSFLAEGMDFKHQGIERASIPTSHWGTTGAMTFMPGDLVDYGEIVVELHHDPLLVPPVAGAVEAVAVTFPDAGASVWTFQGFMTAYEVRAEFEDRIVATATIKVASIPIIT